MKGPIRLPSVRRLAVRPRSRWLFVAQTLAGIVVGLVLFDRAVMPLVVHHSADQKVPELRGHTLADAKTRLHRSDLSSGQVLLVNDEETPAGTVMTQEPVAGAYVRSGRHVNLIVSDGPAVRQVPDLTGKTARLASMELTHAGLNLGITMTVPSSLQRPGEIIGTRPARGERPEPGGAIDLLVSSGPPRGLFLMPDLRGVSIDEAARRLSAAGIHVDGGQSGGQVVHQQPQPGSPIAWGDVASLYGTQWPTGPTQ